MSNRLHIEYLLSQTIDQSASNCDSLLYQEYQELLNCLKQLPRQIPSKYFYDAEGSLLFEQICQLPEYYLTRTETEILENSA
jgi:L-histidine N-alpha-methyltransferase